jgi:hypothetical protein
MLLLVSDEAGLEQFIAKEVPSFNYVIFGGFLFLGARKAYYSETLFAKCHTPSFLSNAYKVGTNWPGKTRINTESRGNVVFLNS